MEPNREEESLQDSINAVIKVFVNLKERLLRPRESKSWNEVLEFAIRRECHLAYRRNSACMTLASDALVNLLLLPIPCPSKDIVNRIVEANCLCLLPCIFSEVYRDQDHLFELFYNTLCENERPINLAESNVWRTHCEERKLILFNGNLLRVIVNYNVPLHLELREEYFYNMWVRSFRNFSKDAERKARTIYQKLLSNGGCMSSRNKRGFRRIIHIVRFLHTVTFPYANLKESSRMFQMYMNMFPDPLVSEEEVLEFLQLFLNDKATRFNQILDLFVSLYGRSVYEPRRLSHLCRCKVRDYIHQNSTMTLPAVVERLPLPNVIKSFLLCRPNSLSQD